MAEQPHGASRHPSPFRHVPYRQANPSPLQQVTDTTQVQQDVPPAVGSPPRSPVLQQPHVIRQSSRLLQDTRPKTPAAENPTRDTQPLLLNSRERQLAARNRRFDDALRWGSPTSPFSAAEKTHPSWRARPTGYSSSEASSFHERPDPPFETRSSHWTGPDEDGAPAQGQQAVGNGYLQPPRHTRSQDHPTDEDAVHSHQRDLDIRPTRLEGQQGRADEDHVTSQEERLDSVSSARHVDSQPPGLTEAPPALIEHAGPWTHICINNTEGNFICGEANEKHRPPHDDSVVAILPLRGLHQDAAVAFTIPFFYCRALIRRRIPGVSIFRASKVYWDDPTKWLRGASFDEFASDDDKENYKEIMNIGLFKSTSGDHCFQLYALGGNLDGSGSRLAAQACYHERLDLRDPEIRFRHLDPSLPMEARKERTVLGRMVRPVATYRRIRARKSKIGMALLDSGELTYDGKPEPWREFQVRR